MRSLALVFGLLIVAGLWACGSNAAAPSCSVGDEGCSCYPNSTCNGALSCRSALCVNLKDGSNALAPRASSQQSAVSSSSTAGASAIDDARKDASVPENIRGDDSSGGVGGSSVPVRSGGAAGRLEVGCTPQCGDAECGPDPVCQTSCGECAVDLECQNGTCRARTPLSRNGGTCADDSDCASNNCGRDRAGERLCYGTLGPNDPCTQAFDCNSGLCITEIPGQPMQVCVDGLAACDELGILDTCTADLAVATCQLDALCGKLAGDFNSCIRYGCMYWHDTPPSDAAGGCEGQLSFARGGNANCPK
jgi:hypothetical protein